MIFKGLTPGQQAMVETWLSVKKSVSEANDVLRRAFDPNYTRIAPRSPREAGEAYQAAGSPYSGDPLYGVGDFYVHPERIENMISRRTSAPLGPPPAFPVDCDDIALWACASIQAEIKRQGPARINTAEVLTVIDAGVRMSHVVCAGVWDGDAYFVDTNGYHTMTAEAGLIEILHAIYPSAVYLGSVPTPAPWVN